MTFRKVTEKSDFGFADNLDYRYLNSSGFIKVNFMDVSQSKND